MTEARRGWWPCLAALAALAALAGLGGCSDDGGPLDGAEEAMAGLEAGRMALQLSATAGADQPAGPVGFRMEGPFSLASEGDLPVLDLRYTRLLGGTEDVVQVVSTGEVAYVVASGQVTQVPEDQTGALRLGDPGDGFADLGIAGWVEDPKVQERSDGSSVVTGKADVSDLLSDLARIGAQVGGENPTDLDGDAAARLDRLARSSEVVVEVAEDDLPRSIKAVVDFGARVPDELREALGPYAAARIELTLTLERLTEPLKVQAPGG